MSARRRLRVSALLFYGVISLAAVAGTICAAILAGRHTDPAMQWLLKCALVCVLVLGVTWAWMRRQGIGWARYGVAAGRRTGRRVLLGFIGGLALAGVWAAIVWLWAPYDLGLNPAFSPRVFMLGTLATLLIGIAEEVGYRSYGLDALERAFGPATAVVLPSLLFAAMHTTGGMPWLAAACVVGSSSVLYGTLMLVTRSLPAVAAFHIANNLLQDALIRTGPGSWWVPSFRAHAADAAPWASIWLCIMAVNLAVAGVLWRRRRARCAA